MPVRYGKNLIVVGSPSSTSRAVREEGNLSVASMPGTVGRFDENQNFIPGNTGDLYILDRDFLRGKTAQEEIPEGQHICAVSNKPKLFLNCLMEKGLDIRIRYEVYVTDQGLITNVKPSETAKVFGHAAESVVTTDTHKLIVIHIA